MEELMSDTIRGDIYSSLCSLDYEVTVNTDCAKNGCAGFYRHQDGTYRSGFWQRADGTVVTDPKQAGGFFFKAALHKGDATILATNPEAKMKAIKKHLSDLDASAAYIPSRPVKRSKEDAIVAALERKCFSMDQIASASKVSHQYVRNLSKKRFSAEDHQANLDRTATAVPEELNDLASRLATN